MTNALRQYVASAGVVKKMGAVYDQKQDWAMIDALLGGTSAMRAAGTSLLPPFPAEETDAYMRRLGASTLYNAFGRTLKTLSAKPFQTEPTFDPKPTGDWETWLDNIDLEGQDFANFAKSILHAGLAKGLCHMLIDFPRQQPGMTLADQRAQNVRPYLVVYRPEQVVGWLSDKVNGYERLTRVRLASERYGPDPKDPDKRVCIEQELVITRSDNGCPWALYERQKDSTGNAAAWTLAGSGVITQPEIPFVTFYARRVGFMKGEPPLLDLAHLNVQHWQSSSDQENIVHVARVPILFGAGFQESEEIVVGSSSMIRSTSTEAKLSYVEHTGKAVEAGRQSIVDIEDRMAALGAELLLKRQTGDKTATEAGIESAEATCELASIVGALEDTFNLAFEIMTGYGGAGASSIPVVTFFKDFAVDGLGAQDMDIVLKMNAAGVVSKKTVFTEAQRRNIVNDEIDFEDDQAEVEKEGPSLEDLATMSKIMQTPPGGDPNAPKPSPGK